MKAFIVYEKLHGELLQEGRGNVEIIGLYKNKQEAIKTIEQYIKSDIQEGFVLDKNNNSKDTFRLFENYQDNYESYFEIVIEEKEIQ